MSVLDVVGASAVGDGIFPIADASLRASAGEVVVVLDVDGGGNSTLVRAACGLIPLDKGSVLLVGADVTTLSLRARARLGVATVLQTRSVSETLTVGENLRVAGADRRQLPEWLASWFPDLVPMIRRRAGLLSGGEQTLLALARAIVRAPRVLFGDEISTGLAPEYLDLVQGTLSRAASQLDTAIVLAEQRPHLLGIADRVSVLSHGRVVFSGAPDDLAAREDLLAGRHLGQI